MSRGTHPTEKHLREFVRGTLDPADIETHIDGCPDCFEKYIHLLELEHDRTEEPSARIVETILDQSAGRRRTWPLFAAAAGLLLALGVGIWYSQRTAPSLELEYKIGSCSLKGRALKVRQKVPAANTVRSGKFSVCDFKFGENISLRLLPVSEMQMEAGGLLRLRRGALAADRRADTQLSVLFDDVRMFFLGTRVVVSRRARSVTVLKGRVEIMRGKELRRPVEELRRDPSVQRWKLDAGSKWRNGRVESVPEERKDKEAGPFALLGAAGKKDVKRILAGVYPGTPIFFQTIHLKNGRVYTGLVYQRDGRHFVVGENGTVSFPSGEIERVQFASP